MEFTEFMEFHEFKTYSLSPCLLVSLSFIIYYTITI